MGAWGEPVAVGKAWDSDKSTVAGGLAAAGGLGVVRGGVEMESRARRGILASSKELGRRQAQAAAARANADARKGKRAEPVRPPAQGGRKPAVTRFAQTTQQQREWADNLDQGVKEQAARVAEKQKALPKQVLSARRVKAGGLGLAALGTVGALRAASNSAERRRMGY